MVAKRVALDRLGPLSSLVEGGDLPYRLVVNRSGSLWLLPESPKSVRGAEGVFAPGGFRSRYLWSAWRAGFPVGARVFLNSRALEDLASSISLGFKAEGVVVYVGTPGAYRKAVLGVWEGGMARAVIKVALVPAADPWVSREARLLALLRGLGTDSLPNLLREGQYAGRAFHVTEPLLGAAGSLRLSPAHLAYAARLFSLEPLRRVWLESPLVKEWMVVLSHEGLGRAFPTLERGLAWLEKRLSHRLLSFGWAHGDFAPWNTRWVEGRLFALDWEVARPHLPPAYDLFHFVNIQAALHGKPGGVPQGVLKAWLKLHAPEWEGLEREAYVVYLLDQSLYYARARLAAPEVGEDYVLRWLLRELCSVIRG